MRSANCGFPGELLSAYLDGEASEEETARVRRHLRDCADCRRELEKLRCTRELLREVPEQPVSSSFRRQLRADLLRHRRVSRQPWRRWRGRLPLVAAVLLLLFLPLAGLYSHVFAPGDPRMRSAPLAEHDPAPESPQLESVEPAPDIDTETKPEELRVTAEDRYEFIVLHVPDVQAGAAALAALVESVETEVRSHEQVWDAEGRLQESNSLLRVPADELADLRDGVLRMGSVARRRTEAEAAWVWEEAEATALRAAEEPPAAPGTYLRVVMRVPEDARPERPIGEVSILGMDADNGPFLLQLRAALSDSWSSFGGHVARVVLWIAGHLPHLAFACVLILAAGLALSLRRENSF